MDIKNAILHELGNDKVHTYRNKLFRVDQETGECVDYLLYFPDFDLIHRTKYYLEAYLLTNLDVLEQKEIDKLEELLYYYN